MSLDRREFVKFLSGAAIGVQSSFGASLFGSKKKEVIEGIDFSDIDDFIVSPDLSSQILISFEDKISDKDSFGANNDYIAVIPIKNNEIILWVNHEYPNAVSGTKWFSGMEHTKEMIEHERYNVGGSLIHLRKANSTWELVYNSPYNRRINANTEIPFVSDRKIRGSDSAQGTFANCAGGVTPWNSILTCEENYHGFYGERAFGSEEIRPGFLGWEKYYPNPPEHYGWVVEVEPKTGKAKKLTGLGRFAHECATCILTKDNRVAVYTADDKNDEFLYKFLSDSADSLDSGELFVADVKKGKWISLDINKQDVLKKVFKDQTDVLIHAREAGKLLGATPLARPEDIEIHPQTGDVFVTLTNNKPKDNYHGSILKISEKAGDHAAMTFKASDFLLGGDDFSCPDNLVFDAKGNLWFATDISGGSMNRPPYTKFKNNGLFFVPMSGDQAGEVIQVASAPTDAELTGLSFSPDGKTLFLSVQHPGEKSKSLDSLTSHWPNGGEQLPRSSVVMLTGKFLES